MSRSMIGSCVQSGFLPVGYVMGCGYHNVMAAHQRMCDAICLLEDAIILTMDGKGVDTARMEALRRNFEQSYEAYVKTFREADGNAWENAITPGSGRSENLQHARPSRTLNRTAKPIHVNQRNTPEHQS